MCNFSPYANVYHVPMGLVLAGMLDRKYLTASDEDDSNNDCSKSDEHGMRHGDALTHFCRRGRRFFERFGASIGVLAMAALFTFYKQDSVSMLYKGPLSYPFLYILFTGTSRTDDVSSRLLARLKPLGKYALHLYILHVPLQRALVYVFGADPGRTVNVHLYYAFVLPATLIVGTIAGERFQSFWDGYCRR